MKTESCAKNRSNDPAFRVMSLVMALLLMLSFSSCTSGLQYSDPTKTVEDCAGNIVEVPENPQRVVCLYASIANIMAMLDEGDKIVGAADGIRRSVLMVEMYPSLAEVLVPYASGVINIEELADLDPDLVLLRYDMYLQTSEREKLEKLGVPYAVVDYYSIDELKKAISVLGEIFNKQEQANAYSEYMENKLELVSRRISDIPMDERVRVYHSINQATCTDVVDSFCSEIMEAAGAISVSVEAGLSDSGKNTVVTLEEIYNWDADVMLCNEYAVSEYVLSQKKWSGLSAVKNKCVYTLPIGATRWAHHGSMEPHMAAMFIAKLLYPERFEDVDMHKETYEFYKIFFRLDLDDETVESILSGIGMRESSPGLTME